MPALKQYPGQFFQISLITLFCLIAVYATANPISGAVFNVKDYYVTGDGFTPETATIQKAINACAQNGGGTVYFPAGEYCTGTLQLFSNMNLFLEAGAVLLASTDTAAYDYQSQYGFGGSGAGRKTGLLVAANAENITLSGHGVIDGRGEVFMKMAEMQSSAGLDRSYTRQGQDYLHPRFGNADGPVMWKGSYEERPGTMVIFANCKNINIQNITLRNSPNWSLHFANCDDADVDGISIDNNLLIPNSDGIDCYDSQNIRISNCDIRAGDDAIAVIGCKNLVVTNCTLLSRSAGIRLGYGDNDIKNCTFQNIVISNSHRGIGIFQRTKGNIENLLFSDIIIETRLHSGMWWGKGEPIHISALPGNGALTVGKLAHIRFTNIIANAESGIVVWGSKESVISDLEFDHIDLTIKNGPLTESYGGNFDLRPANAPEFNLFKHDIPALYANFVNNITITNLKLHWDENLPDFYTSAIQCENFTDILIDGLQGSHFNNAKNGAVLDLANGSGVSVRNCRAGENTQVFLAHKEVTDLRMFINNDLSGAKQHYYPSNPGVGIENSNFIKSQ
ncbi:MAG TPA: glycosyl hydrolase family 28 protein [bacterium]|nr:glycosyl hydrolase family 28 protein [bacterium]HPN43772.1 glycosyl hydrolase family 28 protein [bacterium]